MARGGWVRGAAALAAVAVVLGACSSTTTPTRAVQAPAPVGGVRNTSGYLVYWDQNEEVDFLQMPSGTVGQLMPAWDLNGQVCVVPDGSGRFVGGLDPTLPDQHNPGGLKPYKQPAIGEELNLANGAFSGQVLYVPGPYKMPGQSIGEDSPTKSGLDFNSNSTYTGCVFDRSGNLLGADIATAQGSFPPPDDGRLVEWFAPRYTSYCIVDGPNALGVGAHHVDGIGGLSQPGMMTLADNGDVLLPEAGTDSVLRFDHTSLPTSAAACPGGVYPRSQLHVSTFFKGNGGFMPFPGGVARDPTCDCFAISSYFGNPSIVWVDGQGHVLHSHATVPGTPLSQLGVDPNAYNPFGMAFAPDGTLYFVDIHITCRAQPLIGCGPAGYGGRVLSVSFTNGQPGTPQVVAGGFAFPTSVTLCVPAHTTCPYPTGRAVVAPASGPSSNKAPATGPPTAKPATAGFGT